MARGGALGCHSSARSSTSTAGSAASIFSGPGRAGSSPDGRWPPVDSAAGHSPTLTRDASPVSVLGLQVVRRNPRQPPRRAGARGDARRLEGGPDQRARSVRVAGLISRLHHGDDDDGPAVQEAAAGSAQVGRAFVYEQPRRETSWKARSQPNWSRACSSATAAKRSLCCRRSSTPCRIATVRCSTISREHRRELRDLHVELDEAVVEAYGWPRSVAHDGAEVNRRLLELNRAINAGEIDYHPFAEATA